MEILKEYWPIVAFCLTTAGSLVVMAFRIGALYQRVKSIESNSGKIEKGANAEQMSIKNEHEINNIQVLCRARGEQLARLDSRVEMILMAQQNMGSLLNSVSGKVDRLATSIINLANNKNHGNND